MHPVATRKGDGQAPQSGFDHVVHRFGKHELQSLQEMLGNLVQILLVPFRQDDRGDMRALGGQNLFFQPPDRQHAPPQRDLSGHGHIAAGREIVFEIEPGFSERDAAAFVLGSAFGILLHQRGALVLHGAAVAKNGRSIAIYGYSGAGKSTLAAALCGDGCSFVADDICVVGLDGQQQPMVLPDGRHLKLWKESIDHLKLAERRGIAVKQIGPYRVRGTELTRFVSLTASTPWLAIHVVRTGGKTTISFVARPAA